MDGLQDNMAPSLFRLSDEAVAAIRKMLDPENTESYVELDEQFRDSLPKEYRNCFLNIDFDAAWMPWSYSALSRDDYMVVFSPCDWVFGPDADVVAVVSDDEVLHKEDFARVMQENGVAATEKNFAKVWGVFSDSAPRAKHEVPLRERAQAAVKAAKERLMERSNGFVMEHMGLTIYEKGGAFTIGGQDNDSFDDCTLENLRYGPEELEIVKYCRENGIPLQFNDLRSHEEDVSYEKYLVHLDRYQEEPDCRFTDYEFIVPMVRCVSLEQTKQLIDWIDSMERKLVDVVLSEASQRSDASRDSEFGIRKAELGKV